MDASERRGTSGAAGRVMWIDPDRVLYAGLLGAPSLRSLGAHVVYVALEAPIELALGEGAWRRAQVAVVDPYAAHRVRCEARGVGVILVEPETVDPERLPGWLRGKALADEAALIDRVQAACARLRGARGEAPAFADFDVEVFGERLPSRTLDPRIQRVLDTVKRDPCGHVSGEEFADRVNLSLSRFVHLFKEEVGVPFRRFRAWQRARHLLHHATRDASLLDIALDAGYPDSTHFSHSIRQSFGLKPKDILAGSRRLMVHGQRAGAG